MEQRRCLCSDAGTACVQHSEKERNWGAHSLLTTQAPVCTPNTKAVTWSVAGPGFSLLRGGGRSPPPSSSIVQTISCDFGGTCPNRVAAVSIGVGGRDVAPGTDQEVIVTGPGRHRLLSVIAAVLHDSSVGFVFLKTRRTHCNAACVTNKIEEFDLISSRAFVAFHNRR